MKVKALTFLLLITMILAACSGTTGTPAQALPTVVLDAGNAPASSTSPVSIGGVKASGFVVPAKQAEMAFTSGGSVKTVNVTEGQQVQAGDVLVELDNTSIQLEVDQANRDLREMSSPAAVAAAAQAVASAQKALEDAQDDADSLYYPRASDTLIKNTQGEIDLAKQALARASDSYRLVSKLADGDSRKAEALVAMTNAQLRLNALIAKYNWYSGTPTESDAAMIQANLDAAKAALQETQWYLAALKGEQLPKEATGSRLAGLEAARDALVAAQDRLDATRLVTPISGTVVTVNVVTGEYALPGQILVVVSDVANLQVKTTDLSERDIPRVEVGQPVTVFVEALNEEVPGMVLTISPVADTLGGDVVYKTTIDLDTPLPPGLRAGMSVEVRFGTK